MSTYLKKTEVKNIVAAEFSKYVGKTGGKDYRNILVAILKAIDDTPGCNIADKEMEIKKWREMERER